MLLCLGEFSLDEDAKQSLIKELLEIYRNDPDAGLHAAAEWLLRQWKQGDKLAAIDNELQQKEEELVAAKDKQRQWYVNSQGQTFVILDASEFQMGSPEMEDGRSPSERLHRRKIGRRMAIATKEVTHEQWRFFSQANPEMSWQSDQEQLKAYIRTDDSPMNGMKWYEAAWYCNWLSEQEEIPEDQWCYEKNAEDEYGPGMKAKDNFLELTGYRLPTEAEWEYACRAGASSSRYYGVTETLLPRYAWYLANGNNHTHPVASLKPNDFGLFDIQGNVYEWCYDAYGSYPTSTEEAASDEPSLDLIEDANRRVLRGGAFSYLASYVRSADRFNLQPAFRSYNDGFRPSRTYHLSP